MRRISIAFALALVVGLLAVPATLAASGPKPQLNFGQELNAAQCSGGTLVINVTMKVVNDLDSGQAGNYWAHDNYNKHVQVWQTGPNTFCVVASYDGKFTSIGDQTTPGATDTFTASITGTYQGGYRATITGSLNVDPGHATRGNIGTFDFHDRTTTYNYVADYFQPGNTFTYDWWGWIYHGGSNGTWVNSIDGNSGDITG